MPKPIPKIVLLFLAVMLVMDVPIFIVLRRAYSGAGIGVRDHLALLVSMPFNVFAIGWVLEIAARKLWSRSLTASVRYVDRAGSRQAILPRVGAVSFALGVLLVVGFVAALTVMFFFASVGLAEFHLIWTTLAVLAVVSFTAKAVLNRWMPRRLSFQGDILVFPNGSELARSEFRGIGVREGEKRPPHPTYYRPILLLFGEDAARYELPELSSRDEAEALVTWIESGFTSMAGTE